MTTLAPTVPAPASAAVDSPYRLSFARVLRSEFLKLVTLRSTWWSLGIAVGLSVFMSAMVALATRAVEGTFSPAIVLVMPMQFTMLVAGVLGAIVITGEYSTGMIRSTLTAQPHRGVVVAAKAVAVATLMAAATAVGYVIAAALTAGILGENGLDLSSWQNTWQPLLSGLLAMAVFALIGLGFGFIIRSGAGAIAATVGVLFVLPIVTEMFRMGGEGWQWVVDLGRYLPMSAAQTLTVPGMEGQGAALLTLLAWAAAALLGGWAVLRTRDA